MKKLILKLKYYHKKDIGDFLAERLTLAIMSNQILQQQSKFKIGYVPSHRFRHYFVKGYNQAQILANKLSQKFYPAQNGGANLPVLDIANKTRHTHTQAGLDRNHRLRNLKDVFCIKNNDIIGNEIIFIIDDVTTTGTTINELAQNIKKIYPKTQIRGLVLARNNK